MKTSEELTRDKDEVLKGLKPYLRSNINLKDKVFKNYDIEFYNFFNKENLKFQADSLYSFGVQQLNKIYEFGVLPPNYIHKGNESIFLIQKITHLFLAIYFFIKMNKKKIFILNSKKCLEGQIS